MAALAVEKWEGISGKAEFPQSAAGTRSVMDDPDEIVARWMEMRGARVAEAGPAITGEMPFAMTVDERLRYKQPFTVKIEIQDAGISAAIAALDEFGFGDTIGEALDDLAHTVWELYFSLAAEQERLSSDLQRILTVLRDHLEEVPFRTVAP